MAIATTAQSTNLLASTGFRLDPHPILSEHFRLNFVVFEEGERLIERQVTRDEIEMLNRRLGMADGDLRVGIKTMSRDGHKLYQVVSRRNADGAITSTREAVELGFNINAALARFAAACPPKPMTARNQSDLACLVTLVDWVHGRMIIARDLPALSIFEDIAAGMVPDELALRFGLSAIDGDRLMRALHEVEPERFLETLQQYGNPPFEDAVRELLPAMRRTCAAYVDGRIPALRQEMLLAKRVEAADAAIAAVAGALPTMEQAAARTQELLDTITRLGRLHGLVEPGVTRVKGSEALAILTKLADARQAEIDAEEAEEEGDDPSP